MLTTDQFTHFTTAEIASLTTAQAHALSTDNIASLTHDQLAVLTTTDIAAMSTTQSAAFTGDEILHMSSAQVAAMFSATPLVLDLNGDGISTTSAAHGVKFDITATGTDARYGWTSTTDGLLAIDLNGNGKIDNGSELFGIGTTLADGHRAANGYAALAQYDSNGDGVIDAKDPVFNKLVVWVDANHNGVSDPGELKTLSQLGIVSLDLHGLAGTATNNGNLLGLTSSYTTSDGTTHAMADVWFAKDASSSATTSSAASTTPALSDLLAAPATDLLPGTDRSHAALVHSPSDHATTALLLAHARPLDEDDAHRHGPLI